MGIEPWTLPTVYYVACDAEDCCEGTEPEKDVDSRAQAAAEALAAGWVKRDDQWLCPAHVPPPTGEDPSK